MRATLDGMQSAALFLLWPIAVFLIVGRSYAIMGFILSASLVVLLLLRGSYRSLVTRIIGEKAAKGSVVLDVVFSMSGWIFRLAAGTPLSVVFADSYSYVSAPRGAPEPLSCEHAADAGSYLDEFTALQEIGLGFGRLLMCAFVAALIGGAPLPIALSLSLVGAACASGGTAYLAHRARVPAY